MVSRRRVYTISDLILSHFPRTIGILRHWYLLCSRIVVRILHIHKPLLAPRLCWIDFLYSKLIISTRVSTGHSNTYSRLVSACSSLAITCHICEAVWPTVSSGWCVLYYVLSADRR